MPPKSKLNPKPTRPPTTPLPLHLSARVSPELYDNIIDHLHLEKKTLRSCALTCRSWRTTAQYHLLASITIRVNEFSRVVRPVRAAFNAAMATTRSLSFLCFRASFDNFLEPPNLELHPRLDEVVSTAPALHHVFLEKLDFTTDPMRFVSTTLTSLVLYWVTF